VNFGLIYADPAWTFVTRSAKGKGRSPERHYGCMTLDEIKALPVASMAAENCVLLMWAVDPLLDRAFEVIEAWGFKYKTVGFYWAKVGRGWKPAFGNGYWTRANPEQCLLATRGSPKRLSKSVRRLIMAPVGAHSAKPQEAYGRIEQLVAGPYLEMFARYARPGWSQWGDEIGKTGGIPNPVDLPGYPARVATNEAPLFQETRHAA
jgi:N6-adenosine-specific RNA methylase IME4